MGLIVEGSTVAAEGGYWMHQCGRCGYVWFSRNVAPRTCNSRRCRSPYWNRERLDGRETRLEYDGCPRGGARGGSTQKTPDYWRHECNRCGCVWYSREPSVKSCNDKGCRSPYWNRERVL